MTGLSLLESNQIDYLFEYQKSNYLNDKLEQTKIFGTNSFKIYQTLNKPKELENYDLSIFLMNNYEKFSTIFAVYLLTNFFLLYLLKKKRNFKITFSHLFFSLGILRYQSLSNLPFKKRFIFLILSWNLFLFIYLVLLSNNIKTERIIIKTDDFIDSFEKLSKTTKTFFFYHYDESLFSKSAKNSLLYNLYFKKVKKDKNYFRYIYDTNEESENKRRKFHTTNALDSFFLITSDHYILAYTFYLKQFINDNQFGYINEKAIYEYNTINFYRKNLDKTLKKRLFKM